MATAALVDELRRVLEGGQIEEIGFVIASEDEALALVARERRLGIPYPLIAPIYGHVHGRFRELCRVQQQPQDIGELDFITQALLIINADQLTAWNTRKRLVLANRLSLEGERRLLSLVFSKHFKAQEAWSHRKWVLEEALRRGAEAEPLLTVELSVCEHAASRYPKNYMAWTYRQFIASHLDERGLLRELAAHVAFAVQHVSDHASLQYRHTLFARLAPSARSRALVTELEVSRALLERFPGHEALWCHRRFLATLAFLGDDQDTEIDAERSWVARQMEDTSVTNWEEHARCARAYQLFLEPARPKGEDLLRELLARQILRRRLIA